MHYSSNLEYIVSGYNGGNSYSRISYFSKNMDDNYSFEKHDLIFFEPQYKRMIQPPNYHKQQPYSARAYLTAHSFAPEIFLKPSRSKARLIDDSDEARRITNEIFGLMMRERLPDNISISILPFDEFKALHLSFGVWSSGILGFSVNGNGKKIFVRESHLDELMLVIGHEIGHVLTETLPNKHDEEAKAFAFSIEWAKTIKEHNIANLGLSIKDELDFKPARNGLHDVAFAFVDFMVRKGRKAIDLHNDLIKQYTSIFNKFY